MSSEKPTIVFVPGAWNHPTYYQLVIDRLTEHNYPVKTVELKSVIPLDSPASTYRTASHLEDAAEVRSTVEPLVKAGKEVIVLCHSYGGQPTTDALNGLGKSKNSSGSGGVTGIIYCTSFMLPEGMSLFDTAGKVSKTDAGFKWNEPLEDGLTLKIIPEAEKEALCADVDDELMKKYISIGLMSLRAFTSPIEKAAWRDIPATFIYCGNDNAISVELQQWMIDNAKLPEENVLRLPTASHSPFLSMPDKVFGWIEKVANSSTTASL